MLLVFRLRKLTFAKALDAYLLNGRYAVFTGEKERDANGQRRIYEGAVGVAGGRLTRGAPLLVHILVWGRGNEWDRNRV